MKRLSLIRQEKAFVRPNLDYADIIIGNPLMNLSKEKLKWFGIKQLL